MKPFAPGANPLQAWTDWRQKFKLFETAVNYNNKEEDDVYYIAIQCHW